MSYTLFTSRGPTYPGNIMTVPSFSIFKPNSTDKVETLEHCHIERITIHRHDLPAMLCANDGLVYQVVYDCRIPENVKEFEAIVSFQQHTYGRFAIVRLAKQ